MDLDEIYARRRRRLRELIDARFDGVDGAFADAVGRPRPNISQLLSGTRRMGEDIARSIESELDLPDYWLDGIGLSVEDADLMSAINRLSPDRKAFIVHYVVAETALAEHSATASQIKSSRSRRKNS